MADESSIPAARTEVQDPLLPPVDTNPPKIEIHPVETHTPLDTSKLPHGFEDQIAAMKAREAVNPTQLKKFKDFKPEKPLEAPVPVTPQKKSLWQKLKTVLNGQPISKVEQTITPDATRAQFLQQIGFEDAERVVQLWAKAANTSAESPYGVTSMSEKNLKLMRELELENPGICKTLYENFGVINFSRYTKELLVKQYKYMGNEYAEYGVIMVDRNDPQGALAADGAAYNDLLKQAADKAQVIRVIEFDGAADLDAKLQNLKHNYKRPIQFGVLSTTGDVKDLASYISSDAGFREQASVVLLSQDIKQSEASRLSEGTKLMMKAPSTETNQVYLKLSEGQNRAVSLEPVPLSRIDYAASRGNLITVKSSRVVPRNPDDVTINRAQKAKAA